MKTILDIMSERYGSGLGIFDTVSILWAAEKAADVIGIAAAKAGLSQINRKREKLGLPVATFPYGHRLF